MLKLQRVWTYCPNCPSPGGGKYVPRPDKGKGKGKNGGKGKGKAGKDGQGKSQYFAGKGSGAGVSAVTEYSVAEWIAWEQQGKQGEAGYGSYQAPGYAYQQPQVPPAPQMQQAPSMTTPANPPWFTGVTGVQNPSGQQQTGYPLRSMGGGE